jgi:hypothetical protein
MKSNFHYNEIRLHSALGYITPMRCGSVNNGDTSAQIAISSVSPRSDWLRHTSFLFMRWTTLPMHR